MDILSHGLKGCPIITRLAGGEKMGFFWRLRWGVMDRAVERGKERKVHRIPERIGVDEKSFAKGHRYEMLVYKIDAGTVDYVGDNGTIIKKVG